MAAQEVIMSDNADPVAPFISSVAELECNYLYCDSETVSQAIDHSTLDIPVKVVAHCLSLRLLHIFGPYENDTNSNLVLLANCVHDSERNVLICVKVEEACEQITFNHLNRTFTLKNFKTVSSPKISFALTETDCHILNNPLYEISIFVSNSFKSILKFYGEEFEDISPAKPSNMSNKTPSRTLTDWNEDDSISDISISDLEGQGNLSNRNTSYLTDDETNLINLIDNDLVPPSQRNFVDIGQTSTPKRRLFDSENDEQNAEQMSDQNNISMDSENQDPNNRTEPQEAPDVTSGTGDAMFSRINDIFNGLSEDIKQKFSIEPFIKKNIHIMEDAEIGLTKLSQLAYPSNAMQNFNFVNVIGIVKSTNVTKNRRCQLTICDEEKENIVIQLAFREIDLVLRDPSQQGSEAAFFPTNSLDTYPQLMPGNFVCIRNLCLGIKCANICAHPNQLMQIGAFKRNDAIQINRGQTLAKDEYKRLIELICFSTTQLVINPKIRMVFNHKTLSFAGQLLAKRVHQSRAEVFLLLPFKNTIASSYIVDNTAFIVGQIENMSLCENREMFKKEIIDKLIDDKQIIRVTLYENHIGVLDTVLSLDFLALFNVHVKEDKLFAGFSQFIQHGGTEYARRCMAIDKDTILGQCLSNNINSLLKEAYSDPAMTSLVENFVWNLDDSVCSRMPDTHVNLLAENLNEADSIDDHSAINKKSIVRSNGQGEISLLKCHVNINACKRVESFDDLIDDPETELFRISARAVDFTFEDKNGSPIHNMAELRRHFIQILCPSKKCDFAASFYSMMPKVAQTVATGNHKHLTCPNCLTSLLPYLCIQLYLQDQSELQLSVMLSSPESEELIGCTGKQLIYTDPLNTDISNALSYTLKSYCPHRRSVDIQSKPSKSKGNKSTTNQLFASNPMFDWIIQRNQVQRDDFVVVNSPQIFNGHLFDLDSPQLSVFYIRGIIQSQM